MNWTRAIKKDPNAIEPKWYLNTHQSPVIIDPFPLVSDVHEKYQIAHAAEIIN